MQSLTVIQDFLPLDLGNTDVVMGMQWLGTLGSMDVNWKQLTMKFKLGDSQVVLQGEAGLNKSKVSLKTMMKEIKQEGMGVLVEFVSLVASSECEPELVPNEISEVLVQYPQVFNTPPGLPPSRITNHAIRLVNKE